MTKALVGITCDRGNHLHIQVALWPKTVFFWLLCYFLALSEEENIAQLQVFMSVISVDPSSTSDPLTHQNMGENSACSEGTLFFGENCNATKESHKSEMLALGDAHFVDPKCCSHE